MEQLKRCQKGHYYDDGKHSSCPFCGNQDLSMDIKKTAAKKREAESGNGIPVTRPLGAVSGNAPGDSNQKGGRTVGIFNKSIGLDPVVGWLVAVKGPERGKDYRICAEKNFIGRGDNMDIRIPDETISRENHAIVSYNPKKNNFRLFPGDSKRLVYLNDEEVVSPEELKPYDAIDLGDTQLIFIPFCNETFQWGKENDKEDDKE